MVEMELTQEEAENLIAVEKQCVDGVLYQYPELGGSLSIPLQSADKRDSFILDISRGRINLKKGTYQNRVRKAIVLVRLDLNGSLHRNPDGEEITCPHLHLYREGYGD